MEKIQNLIIGAGPAGLAVAGRMRHAGLDFTLLEKSKSVGNSWRNHYDRLHLHTVKQWSHLPHLPFPESYPTYVARRQFADYLSDYAEHFRIYPRYDEEVISVKKENGKWAVSTSQSKVYLAENVVVATGVNRVPNVPKWNGQDKFKGSISHSVRYRNPQPFLGQRVLVIGMGNTGAEIALDLSEHGVETYLSVRGSIALVPRDLNGRPVQVTAKQLAKIPFGLGDWLGSQIRKIYFGNLKKYGLDIAKEHPAKLLRETGKTPVIDIGTVAAIKAGKIKVVRDISHFTENGVQLKNGEVLAVDSVILATGYRGKVEDFIENGEALLDSYGCPKSPVSTGHHEGIFFVGFDNYKLGGILGTINTDSETVVEAIASRNVSTAKF